MSATTVKGVRLALRLTSDQKATIAAAADVPGQSVTDFTIQTIVQRANEVLADQRVFHVPADRLAEFDALMNAPVRPNRGLADLFANPSVLRTRRTATSRGGSHRTWHARDTATRSGTFVVLGAAVAFCDRSLPSDS